MAILAAASAVEEGVAGVSVAGKEFFDGIGFWNTGGFQRFFGALVQKRGDVGHLFIGHVCERRHALIRTAATNDFADLVTFDVMGNQGRADKIRTAGTSGVGAMAESTGLSELLSPALDGRLVSRILRNRLRPRRGVRRNKKEKECQRNTTKLAWLLLQGFGIPMHHRALTQGILQRGRVGQEEPAWSPRRIAARDRKSTRLNSSHRCISYAVFCLKKKNN